MSWSRATRPTHCWSTPRGNHVSVIVMGAATHGLETQRLVATVPIKVAMDAPCTVVLVEQALPLRCWPNRRTTAVAAAVLGSRRRGPPGFGGDAGPLG